MEKYGSAGEDTYDRIIPRMRFAHRIPKATITHSEYVMFTAFPRQQWFRKRASMLRYMHIAWFVSLTFAYTAKLLAGLKRK